MAANRLDSGIAIPYLAGIDFWPTTWPRIRRCVLTTLPPSIFRRRFGAMTIAKLGNAPMATGTVKWFNAQKGYGFIQPDDGGKEVFVPIGAVERAGMSSLNESQKLSYELTQDKRSGKTSADQLRSV